MKNWDLLESVKFSRLGMFLSVNLGVNLPKKCYNESQASIDNPMSQKNESLILFLALLITGGLLGAGYFLFFGFSPKPLLNTNNPSGNFTPNVLI